MPRQLPTKETIEQVLNYAKSLSNEDVYAYIQSIHDWFVQLANVATNHEETLKSIRELFPALHTWQDLEKVRAQYNADMLSFIANKYYSKLQLFPEKNNILVNSFNELQQTIQFLKDLNSIREDCLEKLNQQRNVQTHKNNEPTVLQSNRTTVSLDESQSNTSTTTTTTTQPTQSVAIDDRVEEEDAEEITPKRRNKRKADEENLKQPPKKKSKQGSLEELKSKLIDFNYTQAQVLKITKRKSCTNTVIALIQLHPSLVEHGFSHEQLVRIAAHAGGSKNLEAVKTNFQALKDLGFTPDHIVKMVQHDGGSKNLEAVKNNFQALKDLGFTPDHIVKMVGHHGGSKNLEAVKNNFQALKDLGFTPDHIVKMVGHNGGSKNLEAVKTNFQALKDLGFTPDHIVKMVQHDGGSKNLEAVKTNFQALKDLGFTPDHIVKMVGHIGGSKNLEAVKTNFQALKDLGFTPDHIVKMVGHDGGSKNLEAVKTNFQALKDLGFTPDHIVKMVGHDGGSKNLEAVKECYDQLKISGLKRSEITNYFSERSRGRDLLRRSLELSSKPLSAWALLFETEKVNTFFQRVNNIGTVIIHKKWATSIASDNGKIIFEVKETYLASQINAFLTRCYKNNTAMRTWCHPPSLSSAEKVSIQLINPSHFISNEQILDTISFLVYLVKYNLKANSSSFLQQLTYTCSNTSSLAALISFDDLCAKFTTEYQHIPLNSMKSFLADFCIGLLNKQFEELNKEAEEKYDSFVLSKLDGRVYIDNYGPFNDFYAEVMLPLDNDAFPAATLPASAMSIPASTEISTSNSMSSTTTTTTSTPFTTKSGVIPTNVDLEENLARSHTAASLFAEEINSPQGINFFDVDIGFDDIFSNLGFFNDFQSSDMTWSATDAMPSSTPATDDAIKERSVEPFIQQDKQEECLIPKPSSNLPRITQRSPAFFAENQPPNFILSRGSNVSSNTDVKQNDTLQLT